LADKKKEFPTGIWKRSRMMKSIQPEIFRLESWCLRRSRPPQRHLRTPDGEELTDAAMEQDQWMRCIRQPGGECAKPVD